MNKLFLLISTFLITFIAIAQKESCIKVKKNKDLNSISKCKINKKDKKPKDLNRTLTKIRNYKKNKNLNIIINLDALERTISDKDFKTAKPFNLIDRIPTFKKCINLKDKKRLNCFNNNMTSHIEKHFHYPNKALDKKIKGKVLVQFIIDKKGKVSNIKATGPKNGDLLINEGKRIVSNLPVLLPGKNKGQKVSVKHEITINFKIRK